MGDLLPVTCKNIFILGDSHVSAFVDPYSMIGLHQLISRGPFTVYRTAPYTCFNLHNKIDLLSEHIQDIESQLGRELASNTDSIFLCYGETDIRHHIGFQTDALATEYKLTDHISNIVDKYIDIILFFKNSKRLSVGIYGVIPSQFWNEPGGNGRPSYKSPVERNNLTVIFNSLLKSAAEKKDIPYVCIYNSLFQNQLHETSIDGIHLYDQGNGQLFAIMDKEFQPFINSVSASPI
tara:strand:- start:1903 stop:2610 length:708 start_codon:yes stop_codon:yes gene_type:complete